MLSFFRDRRARTVIEQVVTDLDVNIRRLSGVERAATFAVSNVILMYAAEMWGREILHSPLALKKSVMVTMVGSLADSHARIVVDHLPKLADRQADDPYVLQANRSLRAFELAIATVGKPMNADAQDAAISAWKVLWASRSNSEEAGRALQEFEQIAKAPAVPRLKRRLAGEDYAKLARTLPPFLQPRKKAGQPQRRRA